MSVNMYNLQELDQAKKRDRKVYITDIAIDKVPYIRYEGFTGLFRECIEGLAKDSPTIEMYMVSLTFLTKCSEAGLFYR